MKKTKILYITLIVVLCTAVLLKYHDELNILRLDSKYKDTVKSDIGVQLNKNEGINFNVININSNLKGYLPEIIDTTSLIGTNYENLNILKYEDLEDRFYAEIGNKIHSDAMKVVVYKKEPNVSLYNAKHIKYNGIDIDSSQSGSVQEAMVHINDKYIYIKTYSPLNAVEIIKTIKIVNNH